MELSSGNAALEMTRGERVPLLAGFPWVFRVWLLVCTIGAGSLILSRALHYVVLWWPLSIDRLLDRLMQASLHSTFLFGLLLQPSGFRVMLLFAALIALVLRRRWFFRRQEEGRLATSPWLFTAIGTVLAIGNIGLDLNPWVALGCAGSTALAVAGRRWRGVGIAAVLAAGFLSVWAALSPTGADAVALATWGAFLALLAFLRRRWLLARDVLALGAFLMVFAQFLAAAIPIFFPSHGGVLLGDGMAYGFCEHPGRGRIYAAVPGLAREQFRDGRIVEYDAEDLTHRRDLIFFDDQFSGRFMQILCLPDTIQAAMAGTWISGKVQGENVMEFLIDDPSKVNRSLWGPWLGQQLLWDEKRDAVFYTSEWSSLIVRLDRRTGAVNREVSAATGRQPPAWLFFWTVPGSFAMAPTPHRGRDSFFVGQWLTGSMIYEIDLDRLKLRRRFEPRSGCIADLAVDETYDRLFATSVWGLDVIDLKTGRVERRIRTGTGARTPVIDTRNGLIYVGTTIEGRMRAFDRETLRLVGVLAIGSGARRGLFSAASGRLLATNDEAYYSWDAAALAARLRSR